MDRPPLGALVGAWVCGGLVVFPGVLVAAHRWICPRIFKGQYRPVAAAAIGAAAVTTGGVLAGLVFDAVLRVSPGAHDGPRLPLAQRVPLYAVSGLLGFALAGGGWRAVAPSHLAHLGAYARRAGRVPAAGGGYATPRQRSAIVALGRRYGCHSCGKRWLTEWICDHQPPNKVAAVSGAAQHFLPQCITCSKAQGASLGAGDGAFVFFHVPQGLRLYHWWLPVGPLVALLWESDQLDVDFCGTAGAGAGAGAGADEQQQDGKREDRAEAVSTPGEVEEANIRLQRAITARDYERAALARDDLEIAKLRKNK